MTQRASSFSGPPDHLLPTTARASLVNRTHRVVRERAEALRIHRMRARSLVVPMAVCALFSVLIAAAIWSLLNQYQEQYELSAVTIPDASNQFLLVLLWFLPLTAAIVALVLLRRTRGDRESRR